MLERRVAALMLAGCATLLAHGGQRARAVLPQPDPVPSVDRCAPALSADDMIAPASESPPDIGAFIDCLKASGYGS